jgi:hypothetical protein
VTLGALVENADRRQSSQQTRERWGVRLRRCRDEVDVSRLIGEAIRDTQFGGRVNETRGEGAAEQAHHGRGSRWSLMFRCIRSCHDALSLVITYP